MERENSLGMSRISGNRFMFNFKLAAKLALMFEEVPSFLLSAEEAPRSKP
jgi:hypothetical protein